MYRDLIENIIDSYGMDCAYQSEYSSSYVYMKAMIQPLNYRYKNFGDLTLTEGGRVDGRSFLYIGKVNPDLTYASTGSLIYCGEKVYRLDSASIYYIGTDPIYCRAVLKLVRGATI